MDPRANRKGPPPVSRHRLLALGIFHALLGTQAHAATIVVDNLGDDGDGCTLRDAIESANLDSAALGCEAGSGADTIVFESSLAGGTILLTQGLLPIVSATTIQGPSPGSLTISGDSDGRLLIVFDNDTSQPALDVALFDLTLSNAGGAIGNGENLLLENSTVTGHTANCGAALLNMYDGTATIVNSTLSDNVAGDAGGAIYNYSGLVTVADSNISNNRILLGTEPCLDSATSQPSGNGGAIFNRGTLRISGSEMTGNSSAINAGLNGHGGAVFNVASLQIDRSTVAGNGAGQGGAIANGSLLSLDGGSVTVADSTLFENSAFDGGAILSYGGTVDLTSSTVSGNSAFNRGGAIITFASASVTIANSTLAANQADNYGDSIFNDSGTMALSNSIVSGRSTAIDCIGFQNFSQSGSLIEDGSCNPSLTGDPGLGPLADNGGPTLTHALLAGSQAIDAGAATCTGTDQRGASRSRDGNFDGTVACDIGAVEMNATVVNTLADTVADDGFCSLREALASAHSNSASGTMAGECVEFVDAVTFAPTLAGGTITLTQGQLSIGSPVHIQGLGANQLSVSGNDSSRVLTIDNGGVADVDVSITGLTLRSGSASIGGAILNREQLRLSNCTISDSTATMGGGIYNDRSDLTVTDCMITNNTAAESGGGLQTVFGEIVLRQSLISSNDGGSYGGAVFNDRGRTYVFDSELSGNTAGQGGGLRNYQGIVGLNGVVVSANNASKGGGLSSFYAQDRLVDSTLSGNAASGMGGGGIACQVCSLRIRRSVISNNSTINDGGGIYQDRGTLSLDQTTLDSNTAGSGGGLSTLGVAFNPASASISNSTFVNNVADSRGGGIHASNNEQLDVLNSTFSGNQAGQYGGGLELLGSGITYLTNTTITGNSAGIDGGGLDNGLMSITEIANTIIANSVSGGDCIAVNDNDLEHINDLIEDGGCPPPAGNPTLTVDPMLGPLADNGGPTLTHALLPGSPAIDAGALVPCISIDPRQDQRGAPRTADGDNNGRAVCDIGAVEFGVDPPPEEIFSDGFE